MGLKKTSIKNTEIAYFDSEKGEKTILFIHGNSLSSVFFEKQLENDELKSKYRLISMDLPGCGSSEFAKNPSSDYSMAGLKAFVLNFAKALDLKNVLYVGHSLGGNILLDIGENLHNAKGILVFGTPPVNKNSAPDYFFPHPSVPLWYKGDLSKADIQLMADSAFRKGYKNKYIAEEVISKSDTNFRTAFAASLPDGNFSDEIHFVGNTKIPIAVFHGENDQLINVDYFSKLKFSSLWRNKVQLIKNTGHSPQYENPEMFNKLLIELFE